MKWKFYLVLVAVAGLSFLTFQNCNKAEPDPCESVTCLNGGTCADGLCKCLPRYTGENCQFQVTPTSIKIKKFHINGFPAYNGGNPWDTYDGPDLYVRLMKGSTEIYKYHKSIINALDDKQYDMIPITTVEIDPETQYTIELWDDDLEQGSNDQKIQTTIKFKAYSDKNGFPDTINVKSFLWDLDISLYLDYIYK